MTELEKAASGLLYDANSDPALLEARAQTSDLCMDYNALRSSQKEEKNALLHTMDVYKRQLLTRMDRNLVPVVHSPRCSHFRMEDPRRAARHR